MNFKFAIAVSTLVISAALPRPAVASSQPFLGQLMLAGFNFCPRGWTEADGQLLPIAENSALFSLFGTIYGGDGRTTFALPDLRGRAPIHEGTGPGLAPQTQGSRGGTESFAMTENQMPMHNHEVNVTNLPGDKGGPGSKVLASGTQIYTLPPIPENKQRVMDPNTISHKGSGQLVGKRSPYLTMKWCVALTGVFPSRS